MNKFRTKYSEDKIKRQINPGNGVKKEYQLRVVNGNKTLVETGETDLYAYIQSHADSVDIHKILERCAMMDDYTPLIRMPAEFMDVSNMPTNLAEAFAAVQDAENFYNKMPISIKEKYNNSFGEFLMDIGSDKFNANVSEFLDSIKPVPDIEKPTPVKPPKEEF